MIVNAARRLIFVATLNGRCCLIDDDNGVVEVSVDLMAPVFSTPAVIGSKLVVITGKSYK